MLWWSHSLFHTRFSWELNKITTILARNCSQALSNTICHTSSSRCAAISEPRWSAPTKVSPAVAALFACLLQICLNFKQPVSSEAVVNSANQFRECWQILATSPDTFSSPFQKSIHSSLHFHARCIPSSLLLLNTNTHQSQGRFSPGKILDFQQEKGKSCRSLGNHRINKNIQYI